MVIFIKTVKIAIEDVKWNWGRHKTTDFRRKVLRVHFDNGTTWTPRFSDIEEISKLSQEVYKHNLQYSDPDKKITDLNL